jgi:hypothetical protein
MDWLPQGSSPLGERFDMIWKRGVRLVASAAIAFALSAAAAIGLGAAVTDNALVQILVTALAALAFWVPFFFVVLSVDRWLNRRRMRQGDGETGYAAAAGNPRDDQVWRQLFAAAPAEAPRLSVLRRSLERSRQSLGRAGLDPDAHELCILIDRRLPDLIRHELETLPPDDRHRRQKVGELIDLVEQFARHCSRRGANDGADAAFEAEVLRRRFEARMTEF